MNSHEDVWAEIEARLLALNGLAHNRIALLEDRLTPESAARRTIKEIRSGIANPQREHCVGPALFLRVAGRESRVYSGQWWFEGRILDTLETAYSRIYFSERDKKRVLRDMLREVFAISREWSTVEEVWALELPAGQTLDGYSGPGHPQKLFANLPVTHQGNRMLVGKVRQFFFPVKNPLWVRQFRNLAD